MENTYGSFSGHDDLTNDADLQIVCKDGVRLSVHSLIMSKWSKVIHDILSDSSDTDFHVVESSSIWKEVLGIIYPVSPVTIIDWVHLEKSSQNGGISGERCTVVSDCG